MSNIKNIVTSTIVEGVAIVAGRSVNEKVYKKTGNLKKAFIGGVGTVTTIMSLTPIVNLAVDAVSSLLNRNK